MVHFGLILVLVLVAAVVTTVLGGKAVTWVIVSVCEVVTTLT